MTALDYRVIKKVASGGSGTVYRAALGDGRIVAVKRFSAQYARDSFASEARLLAGLDHPNIVQFFGIEKRKNGELDLVMEWVGPSVAQLTRSGRVWPTVAVHVMRELLKALDHLHSQEIVHRDVSSRNVLLSPDGRVKLVDFGLAEPENAPRKTSLLRGSPLYISPEQIHGQDVDRRSDLFVVGIVFYELLTGKPPFRSSSAIGKNSPVTPLAVLCPDLPDEFQQCMSRFLAYARDKRYASAKDAIAALDALPDDFLGRAPLEVSMRERGLLPRKTSARNRLIALAAAAGIAAGMAFGVVGTASFDSAGSIEAADRAVPAASERGAGDPDTPSNALDAPAEVITETPAPQEPTRPARGKARGVKSPAGEKTVPTTIENSTSDNKNRPVSQPIPGAADWSMEPRGGAFFDESVTRDGRKE